MSFPESVSRFAMLPTHRARHFSAPAGLFTRCGPLPRPLPLQCNAAPARLPPPSPALWPRPMHQLDLFDESAMSLHLFHSWSHREVL